MKHPSHDWGPDGRCRACGAHVLAFEAEYRCIPLPVEPKVPQIWVDHGFKDWPGRSVEDVQSTKRLVC